MFAEDIFKYTLYNLLFMHLLCCILGCDIFCLELLSVYDTALVKVDKPSYTNSYDGDMYIAKISAGLLLYNEGEYYLQRVRVALSISL